MSYQVYNPFEALGAEFQAGMDYIIKTVPTPHSSVTFEQLNAALAKYFGTIYKPDSGSVAIIKNMVLSILPNSANSYQNGNLQNESFYSQEQIMLLNSIFSSIKGNDIEGIPAVLDDANRDIAESGLSAVDQTPLFAAVQMGKSAYNYWFAAIYNAKSPWVDLLNKNVAINTANLCYWVIAAMEGALSGFAQVQQLDMNVATSLNSAGRSVAVIVAMLAAVGLSSGKMFFKWVQKDFSKLFSKFKNSVISGTTTYGAINTRTNTSSRPTDANGNPSGGYSPDDHDQVNGKDTTFIPFPAGPIKSSPA